MFNYTDRQEKEKGWAKSLQEGNREVIGILYDAYAPVLLGLITKIVRNREIAEDVLLKTYLAVWQHRAAYDVTKMGFLTWMITLAKNSALDAIKSGRYKSFPNGQEFGTFAGQQEQAATGPEGLSAESSFCHLTSEEKAALDLIYLKGYSCSEAAKALNTSEESLKISLKMAVKHLSIEPAS